MLRVSILEFVLVMVQASKPKLVTSLNMNHISATTQIPLVLTISS